MKIVGTSDTHGMHRELTIPKCDIFIHSGDIVGANPLHDYADFKEWLDEIPATHCVIIAGNHDLLLEHDMWGYKLFGSHHYLENSSEVIEDLVIWGSPNTLPFAGAFNKGKQQIKKVWNTIPNGADIIITHGPPYMVGDECPGGNVGDVDLMNRILDIDPILHQSGHIHEGYGKREFKGIEFWNASYMWNKNPILEMTI